MSTPRLLLLGAIAGGTIFLGLPVGRLRGVSVRIKAFLNAAATGVLLFLLIDIVEHAAEPIEHAVAQAASGGGSYARLAELGGVAVACLVAGLMGLVYYDRLTLGRFARASIGPGAVSLGELQALYVDPFAQAQRLALTMACGIGLHNFAEGLAIGQSAAKGELTLALLLVVGFAAHNATEGFGIVAPLAGHDRRPGWGFLALAGLVGGGPTFVGTIVGRALVGDTLFVAFLSLAAGSILYVVLELLHVGRNIGHRELAAWGLLAGLVLGFVTDFILVAAGS